jgi:2-methylaconitate cis-trans-isomerase PrpF
MQPKPITRAALSRHRLLKGSAVTGILALGRSPVYAQSVPKKLIIAHNAEMAEALYEHSSGGIEIEFRGGPLELPLTIPRSAGFIH